MSGHLNEEQLVLHHYGEATEAAAIEEHLASCERCRAGYQALGRVLAAVDAAPLPERGEAYGSEVWERLRPLLAATPSRAGIGAPASRPASPPREKSRPGGRRSNAGLAGWLQPRRWAAAAALAILLAAAFLAGRFWPRQQQEPSAAAIPTEIRERILLVAVSDHLERSQMVLVELANTEAKGTVDISTERQWARDLVGDNRLYRQAAARAGKQGMANVLEELERVLLEIAHSPAQLGPADREEIRRRIEAQGILFKIRVVGSQLQEKGI